MRSGQAWIAGRCSSTPIVSYKLPHATVGDSGLTDSYHRAQSHRLPGWLCQSTSCTLTMACRPIDGSAFVSGGLGNECPKSAGGAHISGEESREGFWAGPQQHHRRKLHLSHDGVHILGPWKSESGGEFLVSDLPRRYLQRNGAQQQNNVDEIVMVHEMRHSQLSWSISLLIRELASGII